MKVVITGGDGFIGKALAAALCRQRVEVIIVDRKRGIEAKDFFDTVSNLHEADSWDDFRTILRKCFRKKWLFWGLFSPIICGLFSPGVQI